MKRDARALASNTYDLVVVGAGIYGIFATWDAAQRGLDVALIDRGDFCGATSSNSLRIVHGGLRYLQQADLGRMRLSIRERRTLMRIAPHLTRPLACVMPTRRKLLRRRSVMRVALAMNDLVGWDRNRGLDESHRLPAGRTLSRAACREVIPGLDGDEVTGGALWHDAQMLNSERLALNVLHRAVEAGATAVNYFEADALIEQEGRVLGVRGRDLVDDREHEVRARCVLNTCGPWVSNLIGVERARAFGPYSWSSAMNLVLGRPPMSPHAFGMGEGGDRLLFFVPWNGVTVVGTTHLPYRGDPDAFRVTQADIASFLAEVNRAHPAAKIRPEEVCFYHAGLLPSTKVDARGEATLLKHHRILDHGRAHGLDGLVSVLGVKWTTARAVAEESIDLIFRKLGRESPPCRTAATPVRGGEAFDPGEVTGVDEEAARLLARDHGSAWRDVLRCGEGASHVLPGPLPVSRAEVLFGIREEMAVRLSDIVFRRTVLGSQGDPGEAALTECARLAACETGWDEHRTSREIAEVRARFLPTA